MADLPSAVISDANVLIDYIKVERTMVLQLVSEHLFQIKLPLDILKEVNELTQDQAKTLGMEIVEPTIAQMREAATRGGALSGPDKLCFAMARDNGWGIWTSDKPLHRKCETENIPTYWGLQLMINLCKAGNLDPGYAIETAQKISEINERISEAVLAQFTELMEAAI